MRYLRGFGRFWYDFIVGDDWRVAVGVVIAVTCLYVATHHGFNAWWFLPLAVSVLLATSVAIAARQARRS